MPKLYLFDLLRMNGENINYKNFTFKEKDQFFTPKKTAKYCYKKLLEYLDKQNEDKNSYDYIEPSAGSGNFLKILPTNKRIGIDIEPFDDEIKEYNYLDWKPIDSSKKYIVIGNPPFGLRGQLALKFINHSAEFADYVAFILPQLFESDGKGVPRKRVKGFNLVHSEKIKTHFEDPDENKINVECIFQIWSKYHKDDKYEIKKLTIQ